MIATIIRRWFGALTVILALAGYFLVEPRIVVWQHGGPVMPALSHDPHVVQVVR